MINLPDMQSCTDGFPRIPINKVGVRNIELPITVFTKNDNETHTTVATMSSYCDLVEDVKGINMSRISRSIFDTFRYTDGYITEISKKCVVRLQEAHNTGNVYLKIKFKYPFMHSAPVTEGLDAPEVVDVTIESQLNHDTFKQYLTVEFVGMSLCPCSKEMSSFLNNLNEKEYEVYEKLRANGDSHWPAMKSFVDKLEKAGFGAHNQKSRVRLTVELIPGKIVWVEDLVDLINNSTSSSTFSVLKRPDEKYVTEVSYMGGYYNEAKEWTEVSGAGPKFVEDIARQTAEQLNSLICAGDIEDYVVVVSNQESIHSNDMEAVAVLSAGKNLK